MADRQLPPGQIGLWSETATLRACITCAPGDEFDRMAPRHIEAVGQDPDGQFHSNPDYLLFDDLVLLPLLQAEHAQLAEVIRAVTGPKHSHDLRTMLQQVVADHRVATRTVDEVLELERQWGRPPREIETARQRLRDLPPAELVQALMSGADPHTDVDLLAWPMPNWMFARDVWATVGDAIVVGYPRPRARKRDGVLARALLHHHPLLRDVPKIDLRADHPGLSADEDRDLRCVEGGDVLVVAEDLVLIGIGERTTASAAATLAGLLRDRGVRTVLGVHLPRRRATMHLDTVFTLVDRDACLLYAEAFDPQADPLDRVRIVDLAEPGRDLGCDLPAVLADLGLSLETIRCGDGEPRAAAREQWSDGSNAFCLGPGRILLYARNSETLRALNRAGFEVMTPERFIANADLWMTGQRRLVVALTGAELSRGRGGPRCLTLPIARAP
jgi:arginine deiminase